LEEFISNVLILIQMAVNYTQILRLSINSMCEMISKISNPWGRLLCRCIIAFVIAFVLWHYFSDFLRTLLSFFTNNELWAAFLGGGIVACLITLGREFYVERKQRLAILNYALQTLESQRIILLGFKGDIEKGQEEVENSGHSLEEWKKLEYPFNSFPKQSVEGYKELTEKLIFIAFNKKYSNVIHLLNDMAKQISELDYLIEYRNEKINQYYQQSIYGEGIEDKQFKEAKDRESRSISKFFKTLDNILAEIRKSLIELKAFGKWYFFFSSKIAQQKITSMDKKLMPAEDHLKEWIAVLYPEK